MDDPKIRLAQVGGKPFARYQRFRFPCAHSIPPGPATTQQAYKLSPRAAMSRALPARIRPSEKDNAAASRDGPVRQSPQYLFRLDREIGSQGVAVLPYEAPIVARVREQQDHAGHSRVIAPLQSHAPLQLLDVPRSCLGLDGQFSCSNQQHRIPRALVPCTAHRHLEAPCNGRADSVSKPLDQRPVRRVPNGRPDRVSRALNSSPTTASSLASSRTETRGASARSIRLTWLRDVLAALATAAWLRPCPRRALRTS